MNLGRNTQNLCLRPTRSEKVESGSIGYLLARQAKTAAAPAVFQIPDSRFQVPSAPRRMPDPNFFIDDF